ncbi:InlB B-repeat-containing protein, partial [bacterium]|nr:InlB B-repeat-containing protein [bacterium]
KTSGGTYSSSIALPVPVRTGYTFTGWFTATSGGTQITISSTVSVTTDTTYYAQWTANYSRVNYNVNGGITPTNILLNVDLDYGWTKDYNTGILWNDIAGPTGVTAPVVSFYDADTSQAGIWYSFGDYAPQDVSTTYTISVYVKTNDSNFYIRAYTADNSETGRQYTDYTLVPNDSAWHRISWTITTPSDTTSDSLSFHYTFGNAQGETQRTWLCAPQMEVGSTATAFNFASVYVPTDTVMEKFIPVLTRTGYTLASWNTLANGSGTTKSASSTKTSSEETWYAQWTANQYTVTFDKQTGTGGSNSVLATFNDNMPTATAPTLTGYTFSGYYTSVCGVGTQYYTSAMDSARTWNIANNTTLYACWTATLTLNSNSGVIATAPSGEWTGSGSSATKTVTYDASVGTLPLSANMSRMGYIFIGWNTASNGSGIAYNSATIFTYASGNLTVYAQWTAISVTPTSVIWNTSSTPTLTIANYSALETSDKSIRISIYRSGPVSMLNERKTINSSGTDTVYSSWTPTQKVTYTIEVYVGGTGSADGVLRYSGSLTTGYQIALIAVTPASQSYGYGASVVYTATVSNYAYVDPAQSLTLTIADSTGMPSSETISASVIFNEWVPTPSNTTRGTHTVTVTAGDGGAGTTSIVITYSTVIAGLTITPTGNLTQSKTSVVTAFTQIAYSLSWTNESYNDPASTIKWYVNGTQSQSGTSKSFYYTPSAQGIFNVTASVTTDSEHTSGGVMATATNMITVVPKSTNAGTGTIAFSLTSTAQNGKLLKYTDITEQVDSEFDSAPQTPSIALANDSALSTLITNKYKYGTLTANSQIGLKLGNAVLYVDPLNAVSVGTITTPTTSFDLILHHAGAYLSFVARYYQLQMIVTSADGLTQLGTMVLNVIVDEYTQYDFSVVAPLSMTITIDSNEESFEEEDESELQNNSPFPIIISMGIAPDTGAPALIDYTTKDTDHNYDLSSYWYSLGTLGTSAGLLIGIKVGAQTNDETWFNTINTDVLITDHLVSSLYNSGLSKIGIWLVVRHGLAWPVSTEYTYTYTFTIEPSTDDE